MSGEAGKNGRVVNAALFLRLFLLLAFLVLLLLLILTRGHGRGYGCSRSSGSGVHLDGKRVGALLASLRLSESLRVASASVSARTAVQLLEGRHGEGRVRVAHAMRSAKCRLVCTQGQGGSGGAAGEGSSRRSSSRSGRLTRSRGSARTGSRCERKVWR